MLLGYETTTRATPNSTGRCPGATAEPIGEARNRGLHAIRFEFIVRLLQLNSQIVTLSIYWDGGREFARKPAVEDVLDGWFTTPAPLYPGNSTTPGWSAMKPILMRGSGCWKCWTG
jgi:hypothetical protein